MTIWVGCWFSTAGESMLCCYSLAPQLTDRAIGFLTNFHFVPK